MVRISISPAAFGVISATLPLGSVGFETEPDAKGERHIWVDRVVAERLASLRGPGESYSDVVLRIAEIEAPQRP
jgi:hypothetical protein